MSAWAYRCHPCVEGEADWFISQLDVERLGPDVQIVRVRVGRDWKCALLDRTQAVVVDNQLLRNVIVSDEADCPECAEMLAIATSTPSAGATESVTPGGSTSDSLDAQPASPNFASRQHASKVQAAAISSAAPVRGCPQPDALVASPGEADMAIEDLRPYFGGVPVVLMAQKDDGSPRYHGAASWCRC